MLNLDGQNLKEALTFVKPKLDEAGVEEIKHNAEQIVSAVVNTYSGKIKAGEVGQDGSGPSGEIPSDRVVSSGLVYGRIQSGKTRAMIISAALAFDNRFQIVVVLTSNNNRLVDQTRQDFQNGLPGCIKVYSKTHFRNETDQAKQILESGEGGIVIVCSKGSTRLEQAIDFLNNIGAKEYASVIFDDEGDQATLDTNTLKRSTMQPLIPPSTINRLIHNKDIRSLKKSLPRHVFVSVTGTPSGIVLQNIDSTSRPSFIELLEVGRDYVGGETFFRELNPVDNKLITLIDTNERVELLGDDTGDLPEGLKSAIRFFFLAAAAASVELGWPEEGGYKLLCHPSVRNKDQDRVAKLVRKYLTDLSGAFSSPTHHLYNDLKVSYDSLKAQTPTVPDFDTLLGIVKGNYNSREVLLLNKYTTGDDLSYSRYFNILIGGNTLGRGLAIKKLIVTYYVRESKVAQMDTMYQHARMFGYRKDTLPYTRVFLPPQLCERFRQIYESDEALRAFIEAHKDSLDTLPVRIAKDIRATRKCVLDARKVDVLYPGKQIFPNRPYYKGDDVVRVHDGVIRKLRLLFPRYETKGATGKQVSLVDAKKLIALIKTKGTNVWKDKKMPAILSYLGQQFGSRIILKYRTSERTPGPEGALVQGVLAGSEVDADVQSHKPVLWIIETTFNRSGAPADWNGQPFIYPTLVIPQSAQIIVFNKS